MIIRTLFAFLLLLSVATASPAADIPIIDAHSQIDHHVDPATIVPLLDKAGVARVILSARGKVKPSDMVALARAHPGRITASVRTKGKAYAQNWKGFNAFLESQMARPEFSAMAELLLYHAAKGSVAPKWALSINSPPVKASIEAAMSRGWPVVLHYEFAAAGQEGIAVRKRLMRQLEGLLHQYPDHPFVLIHMGQLGEAEVQRLIEIHRNIHFIPSWSNSVTSEMTRQPWVTMFNGPSLSPVWENLINAHPDRFILGFDNVFASHWGDLYIRQVSLWRKTLKALPDPVAHAVAHGNAERLWKLSK